jgi:hypothetical protein
MIKRKPDFPPLLAPGRHRLTLVELKELVQERFTGNLRRRNLFFKVEEFIQALLTKKITCEVWINGSLLTEKPEPSDIDATIIIDCDVEQGLSSEERAFLFSIEDSFALREIDLFVLVRYPKGHEYYGDEANDPASGWHEQYGIEHSETWLKGFVVMRLGETRVGLRLYR